MYKQFFTLFFGFLAFVLIWAILVILSPLMIAIILGKISWDAIFKKKLDAPKVLPYVPATTDNNFHSAN